MRSECRVVLWWGRGDPAYSRNRIVRAAFRRLGWIVQDFRPHFSPLGDLEARLRVLGPVDLVWVPSFRQRDVAAARRWANRARVPLIFDPLISSYDKKVNERGKFSPSNPKAAALRSWEAELFVAADLVVADTVLHARYFAETFALPEERLAVIPVGAEETIFHPAPWNPAKGRLEALFWGSFIGLQGPQVIVEAARLTQELPLDWVLLGTGPLRAECERRAAGLANLRFEDWYPYETLGERIRQADLALGIFGGSDKAGRVIPNKVYQALACGRPLVTRETALIDAHWPSGVHVVPPEDPRALAETVARLAVDRGALVAQGEANAAFFREIAGETVIAQRLSEALRRFFPDIECPQISADEQQYDREPPHRQ